MQLADSSSQLLRNMALDAMDKSICAVLGSHQFQERAISDQHGGSYDVSIVTQKLEDVFELTIALTVFLYQPCRWKLRTTA